MIVEPKVREFICTTAHPEGCKENVKRQIAYVKEKGQVCGPKKVLVIGASTGYGLASRITAAFACQAATIGIMFEKPSNGKRTATPAGTTRLLLKRWRRRKVSTQNPSMEMPFQQK